MSRPRVLLADDHRMMAEGLKALLPDEFELVGIVEDGRAMIEAAERLRPDVIVADVAMPNLNGFEAFARLRTSHPSIKVVFLTMHRTQRTRDARWTPALPASWSTFGPRGIGCGHPCSFEGEDFHNPFLDEAGGRTGRKRC